MFKKLLLFAAVVLISNSMANALTFSIPRADNGDLASSDYGGVSYSTASIAFSTNPVLSLDGYGSVVGFIASSNTAVSDFVTFHDTDSVKSVNDPLLNQVFKIHLSSTSNAGSASINNGQPYGGTYFKFPAPVRFLRGCAIRTNSAAIETIRLLYTKFGDQQ